MPHTESRYQQDLGFTDGISFIYPWDFIPAGAGAPTVVTRNGVGDYSYNIGASIGPVTFAVNLAEMVLARTGFGEDIQNQFGGTGISGSAQPQFYRPDISAGMSANQELSPRAAFKTKGYKPLSLKVIELITGAALTTHTCRIDKSVFANNVALASTSILASGANGLPTAIQANPYVTVVNFPAAAQVYQITDLAEMWFELTVTTQAAGAYRFYGVEFTFEYNFN